VARLLKRFDPHSLRAILATMKLRGLSIYGAALSIAGGHAMPTSLAQVGARHRSTLGGSLRAGVFGVSVVLGVAGAGAGSSFVLTSGVAGLLTGRSPWP
jgi:hypothetical protein